MDKTIQTITYNHCITKSSHKSHSAHKQNRSGFLSATHCSWHSVPAPLAQYFHMHRRVFWCADMLPPPDAYVAGSHL